MAKSKLGRPVSYHGGSLVKKLVGEEIDSRVRQSKGARPRSGACFDGPYLCKAVADLGGELPSANDAPSDPGTHDVNEKMLAKANRRGLRVHFGARRQEYSLEFLIGGKR